MVPDYLGSLYLGLLLLVATFVGVPVMYTVIGIVLGVVIPRVSKTRGALIGLGVGTLTMVLYALMMFAGWRRSLGLTPLEVDLMCYPLGAVVTVAVIWFTRNWGTSASRDDAEVPPHARG